MERYFKGVTEFTKINSNITKDNNAEENTSDTVTLAVATCSSSSLAQEEEQEVSIKKEKKDEPSRRNFRSEWVAKFPWIIETPNSVSCKYCSITLTRNHAHLKRHESRDTHQIKMKASKSTADITQYLHENSQKKLLAYKTKKAEFLLVMGLVEHNLPFLLMDHLPQLLKQVAPDSEILKNINCARTKSKGIVKTMGNESQENLAAILRERKFSLIIDETTDISVKKCLAILVRYVCFENNKIRDRLISLEGLNDLTATGITTAVLQVLDNLRILRCNLIGFAGDNAFVMMGNYNGVQAKLKEIVPDIFVLGCICHSMALCCSHAANVLLKEIEDFTHDLYNYLNTSSKRLTAYKEFQDFVDIKPHKILRLSQTMWLSLEAVVLRILEQWPALTLYFQGAVLNDNLTAAEGILSELQNITFKLYITFLSYIVPLVNKINVEFQSEKPKLHIIYERITSLYKTILKSYMQSEYVEQERVSDKNKIHIFKLNPKNVIMYLSNEDLYLGEECGLLLLDANLSQSDVLKFKKNCLHYYVTLCEQIKMRFQNVEKYEHFGVLNPKGLLEKPISITPLLHQFLHLTNNKSAIIGTECRQISSLPVNFKNELEKLHFQDFWFELYKLNNSDHEKVFKHLCEFVFNLLSLPHSSAAAERTFSALNLIKSKTRNRLLPETCNALLLPKELLGSRNCYSWKPSKELLNQKCQYD